MNGLKIINDLQGHAEGDKALKAVAKVLLNVKDNNCIFYRIGGDEFSALCLNKKEKDIQELVETLNNEFKNINYSCSIGYSYRKNNENVLDLYKDADNKMYKIKEDYYKNKNIIQR